MLSTKPNILLLTTYNVSVIKKVMHSQIYVVLHENDLNEQQNVFISSCSTKLVSLKLAHRIIFELDSYRTLFKICFDYLKHLMLFITQINMLPL